MRDHLVAIAFCRSVAEHGDETHAGLRVRVVAIMHALLQNLTSNTGSHCHERRSSSIARIFLTPVVPQTEIFFRLSRIMERNVSPAASPEWDSGDSKMETRADDVEKEGAPPHAPNHTNGRFCHFQANARPCGRQKPFTWRGRWPTCSADKQLTSMAPAMAGASDLIMLHR